MKEKKKQRYKENQNVDKTDIILTKDKELDRQKTRYSEKLTRNKNRRRKIYIIFSHKKNPPSSKLDISTPVVWEKLFTLGIPYHLIFFLGFESWLSIGHALFYLFFFCPFIIYFLAVGGGKVSCNCLWFIFFVFVLLLFTFWGKWFFWL